MKQEKKPSPTFLQMVRQANVDLANHFSPKVNRSLKATGASWTANILMG